MRALSRLLFVRAKRKADMELALASRDENWMSSLLIEAYEDADNDPIYGQAKRFLRRRGYYVEVNRDRLKIINPYGGIMMSRRDPLAEWEYYADNRPTRSSKSRPHSFLRDVVDLVDDCIEERKQAYLDEKSTYTPYTSPLQDALKCLATIVKGGRV